MRLQSGTRIAEITLDRKLGSGGQGEVWAGKTSDGRQVAVKVLNAAEPISVLRAMREARLQGTVRHPNIVRMLDFQLIDGVPVIVSELVDGLSLRQLLRQGRPTIAQIDQLAHQLMDGVEAAHEFGLVHRDLKPANVLLTWTDNGYHAKITDFGIAVEAAPFGAGDDLSGRGMAMGTVGFMAPEQFLKRDLVDDRADLFGLAAVLYWVVTGRRAFSGSSWGEVLRRSTKGQYTPIPVVAPEIRDSWAQAIHWALDPNPNRRPPNVAVLRKAWNGGVELPEWIAHGYDDDRLDLTASDDMTEVETNLPDPAEASIALSFGRHSEVARVRGALEERRIVTVRGSPGVGKTHLADQVAASWVADGQDWVQCYLTEAHSPESLLVAIAAGLAVPTRGEAPEQQLARAIAGRGPVLVVLDNAEQVAAPLAALLGRLLELAPEARFLVTSRRALGLPEETVLDLGPLDDDAGYALFQDRANRSRPSLSFAETEQSTIRALIGHLEGNPLAIELAAARAVQSSSEALLAELQSGDQTQERAMRVALGWSWRLLKPWEKHALGYCVMFRGGCSMEPLEQIIDLSPWPEAPDVMDVVHGLVDHSLIQLRGIGLDSRLFPYQAVRTFVLDAMHPKERTAARRAHATWFAGLGSAAGLAERKGPGGINATRLLLVNTENIAAALDTAIALKEPSMAVDCAAAVAEALTRLGPPAAGLDRVQAALRMSGHTESGKARLLVILGHLLQDSNQPTEATKTFEAAALQAKQAGDADAHADALIRLGMIAHHGANPTAAISLYQEALATLDEQGPPWRRSHILRQLSAVQQHTGAFEAAEQCVIQALAVAEEHHIVTDIPLCHIHLGSLRTHQGRPDEAMVYEQLALQASQRMGDRVQEGRVLANLGVRLHQLGKPTQAIKAFERAARIARHMGSIGHEGIALGNLGETLMSVKRNEEAEEALNRAIELGDQTWPVVAGTFRTTLARFYAKQARYDEAMALLDVAEPMLDGVHRTNHAALLVARAELAARQGHEAAARRWLDRAQATYGAAKLERDPELAERIVEVHVRIAAHGD